MNSNYNVQLFLVTPCLSPKIFKNVSHLTRETGPNFQLSGKQSAFTEDVHSFFFWSSQLTFSKCRPQLFTPGVWKNEVSKKLFQFQKSPESMSKDSVGNMCELLLSNKYEKGASCGFGQVFQKC